MLERLPDLFLPDWLFNDCQYRVHIASNNTMINEFKQFLGC
jgi:hypothetical protein